MFTCRGFFIVFLNLFHFPIIQSNLWRIYWSHTKLHLIFSLIFQIIIVDCLTNYGKSIYSLQPNYDLEKPKYIYLKILTLEML